MKLKQTYNQVKAMWAAYRLMKSVSKMMEALCAVVNDIPAEEVKQFIILSLKDGVKGLSDEIASMKKDLDKNG